MPVSGRVTDKQGAPLEGVTVYGSVNATTDKDGRFRVEHAGPVIRFRKDNFEPQAYVVDREGPEIQISLEPSLNDGTLPVCVAAQPHQKEIGWGEDGIRFSVSEQEMKMSGGVPDVDYVRYVIQSSAETTQRAFLELWFGSSATTIEPDDQQLIASRSFHLTDIRNSEGQAYGMDSRGESKNGKLWRKRSIFGEGMSRYNDVGPEEARRFDRIVDSMCFRRRPSHSLAR